MAFLLLAVAASAQPPPVDRPSSSFGPLYSVASRFAYTPFPLCRRVVLSPVQCAGGSVRSRRPTLPVFGRLEGSTFAVGRWRGEDLSIRVTLAIEGFGARAFVQARTGNGVLVDTLSFDADGMSGIWSFCRDGPVDFDGDGIREVGVAEGRGGGPYSVNVGVAVVRFAPESVRLTFWPDAEPDPWAHSSLTTPTVSPDGRTLRTSHRGWGFGRAWTIAEYSLPADTLVLRSEVNYHVVEDVSYEDMDDMLMTRTVIRPGRAPAVSEVWFVDVPPEEGESFGC